MGQPGAESAASFISAGRELPATNQLDEVGWEGGAEACSEGRWQGRGRPFPFRPLLDPLPTPPLQESFPGLFLSLLPPACGIQPSPSPASEHRPFLRTSRWDASGLAPSPGGRWSPALSHPSPPPRLPWELLLAPSQPPHPSLLPSHGPSCSACGRLGRVPHILLVKVKLCPLDPDIALATSLAGVPLPPQDFLGVLLWVGCAQFSLSRGLTGPACGLAHLGAGGWWWWWLVSRPWSLGLPELVLGIAETFRHKVDRLVGLVLVRLHGRSVWVEGPDLRLLRQGVLGETRGLRSPTPQAPWVGEFMA